MPTIIEHTPTAKRYALIGAAYGMSVAATHGLLGFPWREKDQRHLLSVCDENGKVWWMDAEEARVVSIDGLDPAQVVPDAREP